MKTDKIILLGIAALALSKGTLSVGNQISSTSPQQAAIIGETLLSTNTSLNIAANNAKTQEQYQKYLDIQKQIASLELQNVQSSGFMTFSDGFTNLANSLGIKL